MLDYALLPRGQDGCIDCPTPDPCNCGPGQRCIRTTRGCNVCPVNTCVADTGALSASGKSGGVSKGALAGAVIGTLVFLALAVSLFLWFRKNNRLSAAQVKDVPASAEAVLQRPDPIEKSVHSARNTTELNSVRVFSTRSSTTIDLDPESQNRPRAITRDESITSTPSNPFEDNNSIQTTGTEGTNVIPIALVPPDPSAASNGPSRPVRSPDLTLNYNLEHVNVSNDSVRPIGGYTASQISGFSSRQSYMSNASYSSDFLNEAPMIVTANKGNVRQVLGVVKPEVISANSLSPTSAESLKPPPSAYKRPPVGSPLASASFGPADIAKDSDDGHSIADPFDDRHCSTLTNLASPAASVATFGQPSPLPTARTSTDAQWGMPIVPHVQDDGESRPSSLYTQAGSVIGIENATRVHLGMSYASDDAMHNTSSMRSPNRTTMGRLVTPPSASAGILQEQQQKALAVAQARAQAQDPHRRISGSSVLSSASTRADSILESFPFVPPSPISNRPVRTPPVSPLTQQSFTTGPPPSSPLAKQTFTVNFSQDDDDGVLPPPPNRRTLGLSTGSQFSTASSGLGSFPFQIEGEPNTATSNGRQRASLDTLAITNDLSSYPLSFDRDSSSHYKQH